MADILVIEDDGVVRDALRELLTRAGHCVRVASDGGSGVGVFRSQRPDLVILDRHLPVLSGSAVFANIRALAPEARIILLSGHDDPEAAAVYLNHGAAAFLSKGDGLSNVLHRRSPRNPRPHAGSPPGRRCRWCWWLTTMR